MSNVIEFNELQSFYFEMQKKLSIKNNELEKALSSVQAMKSNTEKFSQFFAEGYINEIEYTKVRKKIKSVCAYYEGRIEKLNSLITDIEDYINEYEMEFGKP